MHQHLEQMSDIDKYHNPYILKADLPPVVASAAMAGPLYARPFPFRGWSVLIQTPKRT